MSQPEERPKSPWFRSRLPDSKQIVQVYALIAFLAFGWMMLVALWTTPSWLISLTIPEILVILAYSFAITFVDSLLGFGVLLLAAVLWPRPRFRDEFGMRAGWMVFAYYACMIVYVNFGLQHHASLPLWLLIAFLAALALGYLSRRLPWVGKITGFADRLIILLYILIPVSALSILTVLVRNLG